MKKIEKKQAKQKSLNILQNQKSHIEKDTV